MFEAYEIFKKETEYWEEKLTEKNNEPLYELAFFKIFVRFEQFMIKAFINYSTGECSNQNCIPDRRLKFESLSHLEGLMIYESKKYLIEKPESIEQLSKHIFLRTDNPFNTIFSDASFSDNKEYMRVLRNFIAHGSESSYSKYKKTICNGKDMVEPYKYLLKKRKNEPKTNYTVFTELLKVHSEIIFNYQSDT